MYIDKYNQAELENFVGVFCDSLFNMANPFGGGLRFSIHSDNVGNVRKETLKNAKVIDIPGKAGPKRAALSAITNVRIQPQRTAKQVIKWVHVACWFL